MKIEFYLTSLINRILISSFYLLYFFLLLVLLYFYFYDPVICDSGVESINDMTYSLNSNSFNNEENERYNRLYLNNESIDIKSFNILDNYKDNIKCRLF